MQSGGRPPMRSRSPPTTSPRPSKSCQSRLCSPRRSSGCTRTGASASSSDSPAVMNAQEWIEVIVLDVGFVAAALAAGTETALTSVGRLRGRFLGEQGSKSAAILQKLRSDPNRYLSTVLFTNTLALIVASTSTTLLTDSLFTHWGVPSVWRLWLAPWGSLLVFVAFLIAAAVTPQTLVAPLGGPPAGRRADPGAAAADGSRRSP